MFSRLLIATVVTTTTLTSVAWQQAGTRGPQRHLLLFTDLINCPPCRHFDRDYKSDANFRNALNRDYQLHQPYTPQRDQAEFRRHSVGTTPTWLIMDSAGNELGRVSGYAGAKDFWERLCLATPVNRPPAAPPAEDAPSIKYRDDILQMGTPQESEFLQRLRSANRELEKQRDDLQSRIRTLEKDLGQLRSAPTPDSDCQEQVDRLQQQLQSARASLAATQQRMQAETEALREQVRRTAQQAANAQAETERLHERLKQPPAKPFPTPPKPADDWLEKELQAAESHTTSAASISTEIPPPDKPPDKLTGSWSAVFQSVAVAAVTVAAPQFAIPLSAGLGAVGWLWHRRRQRQSAAAVPPRVVTVDAPPLPQVTQTDTRFVNVEKDTFARAHAWAQEQLVRRYPGAVPSVETLNSLIQQYLNATKKDP